MAEVKLRDVVKNYGQVFAVDHVSLTVEDGEFVALVGPSGCGKTTTLNLVAGLIPMSDGDILIGDRPDVRLLYLYGDHDLIAERLTMRNGHFMPPKLLDTQIATLEEPGPDEHPLTVSVDGTPKEIVDAILKKLGR